MNETKTKLRVTFLPSEKYAFVEKGASIFDAAMKAGVEINSVCGGQKQCGKCRVIVRDGEYRKGRTALLSLRDISEGCVLACDTFVQSDLTVAIPIESIQGEGRILRGEKAQSEGEEPTPLADETGEIGLAVDIGTTTVVAHLVDMNSGRTIDIAAKYNSQAGYGEDYIKRIIYLEEHNAADEMQRLLIRDINDLVGQLCQRNGLECSAISGAAFAGNTAMHHFLLGLDPSGIRREPFEPVTNFPSPQSAQNLGININPEAVIDILPSVSVYVGADIVAGVLATGLHRQEEISLQIDIGTNGEIVLGGDEWVVCCSASAGPSFEGGGVKFGMRAMEGAIEDIAIDDKFRVKYGTIGSTRPKGICGSGLIDCLAEMFRVGLLERNGKLREGDDSPVRRDEDGTPEFVLAPAAETLAGRDIVINQIDIQDLVRSKGAVFAAIAILVESMGIDFGAIKNVFIAGGFGNYLNIANAVRIGLLPDLPSERYHFVGNTAISGARRCLCSREALAEANEIARAMTYFDLMKDHRYMDYYQQALFIPHTNMNLFPSV